jgi:acyl phosphate:glycerol-3-phosphate acyltransferase
MGTPLLTAFLVVLAYALGGIPTAHLIARKRGADLRTTGSGNLGATNASRSLGLGYGIVIGVIDIIKGIVPVLIVMLIGSLPLISALAVGIAVVLGHVYTPYLRPHIGGKGVATGAGVVAVLFPQTILFALAIFFGIAFITRYVSLASITTFAALIPLCYLLQFYFNISFEPIHLLFLIILDSIILHSHRANLKRLVAHTETKFKASGPKEDR